MGLFLKGEWSFVSSRLDSLTGTFIELPIVRNTVLIFTFRTHASKRLNTFTDELTWTREGDNGGDNPDYQHNDNIIIEKFFKISKITNCFAEKDLYTSPIGIVTKEEYHKL